MDICFFNYRGYGSSTGTPTPDNLKSDGKHVYEYIKLNYEISSKILIHGESIGGMVAIYLAKLYQHEIALLIADR